MTGAPNQAKKAAEARNGQVNIAQKFAQEFENESTFNEHLEETRSPNVFLPGPKAKH